MSTRVTRARKAHREEGYKYVTEEDFSSSGSSYDSNDYDDDDDGRGRSEEDEYSSSIEDYTDEDAQSVLDNDETALVVALGDPVCRKLNFDLCVEEEDHLDYLEDDAVVPEPPRKKAKKNVEPCIVIDLQ